MTTIRAHLAPCALVLLTAAAGPVMLSACNEQADMAEQRRVDAFEASALFADGAAARPIPEGTVSREGVLFSSAPPRHRAPRPRLDMQLLEQGRSRFEISCTPCHGHAGYGDGLVVQRGYPAPPSFHDERLRTIEDAHLYDVIVYGLGKMPPMVAQAPPGERWAVVAYVRALQLSQLESPQPTAASAPATSTATTPESEAPS